MNSITNCKYGILQGILLQFTRYADFAIYANQICLLDTDGFPEHKTNSQIITNRRMEPWQATHFVSPDILPAVAWQFMGQYIYHSRKAIIKVTVKVTGDDIERLASMLDTHIIYTMFGSNLTNKFPRFTTRDLEYQYLYDCNPFFVSARTEINTEVFCTLLLVSFQLQ